MNIFVCLGLLGLGFRGQLADLRVYTESGDSFQSGISASFIGRPYDLVYDRANSLLVMATQVADKTVIKCWRVGSSESTDIPLPLNTSIRSRFFKQKGHIKLLVFHAPTGRTLIATVDPTVRSLILDSDTVDNLEQYDKRLAPKDHDRVKAALQLLHWGSPTTGTLNGPGSIPINNVNAVIIDTLIAGTSDLKTMAMAWSTGASMKIALKQAPSGYVQYDIRRAVEDEVDRYVKASAWGSVHVYSLTADAKSISYGMTAEVLKSKWLVVWLNAKPGQAPTVRSLVPGLLARSLKSFD